MDCKVYVCAGFAGSYNSYWLDTEYIAAERSSRPSMFPTIWWRYYTVVFAEKGPASTFDLTPEQLPYRSAENWGRYLSQLSTINSSQRPHLVRSVGALPPRLARREYKWINKRFEPKVLKPSLPRRIIRIGMHWYYRSGR